MKIEFEEVTCKSSLTGGSGHYRLNPYVGCQHKCIYCYATFIARWRGKKGPWGSWVQIKTNIVSVLRRELHRKKGVHIFLSTVCDVYQPIESKYQITRQCLEVLCKKAHLDPQLDVFLLTKSDMVRRDCDILSQFPRDSLEVAFSITTHRDEIAKNFELYSPSPSERIAAARTLKKFGLKVGMLINPILPYITEQDMRALLQIAEDVGLDFVGFDTLNYICGHVGSKVRPIYEYLGGEALERFEQAKRDPLYKHELQKLIAKLAREGKFHFKINPLS